MNLLRRKGAIERAISLAGEEEQKDTRRSTILSKSKVSKTRGESSIIPILFLFEEFPVKIGDEELVIPIHKHK